jgi:hypothetical protein
MEKLPKPNPPGPESPLPAWQHYEITRITDLAIQKQLPTEPKQKEFLIGLEVQYSVSLEENGEETSYAMPFGKVVSTLEETRKGRTALSDDFLDKIYARVDTYIRENIQPPYHVTNVMLQVRTNRALNIVSCTCLTIGSTYRGYPVKCRRRPTPEPNGSRRRCCWNSRRREWICARHNRNC